MPQLTQTQKRREPLVVYVAKELDGYTYALHPTSEDRVQQRHPQKKNFSRIFLSQDVKVEFTTLLMAVAPALLQLLTGLSPEVLQELGNTEFRDPLTDRVLFTWTPAHP